MSNDTVRLKHPSGFFAAGNEVGEAMALLSDGGFKVFVYVASTPTGAPLNFVSGWPSWPKPWVTALAP